MIYPFTCQRCGAAYEVAAEIRRRNEPAPCPACGGKGRRDARAQFAGQQLVCPDRFRTVTFSDILPDEVKGAPPMSKARLDFAECNTFTQPRRTVAERVTYGQS